MTTNITTNIHLIANLVSCGLPLADVENLGEAELLDLTSTYTEPYITDPLAATLKALKVIKEKELLHRLAGLEGAAAFLQRFDYNTFAVEKASEAELYFVLRALEKLTMKAKEKKDKGRQQDANKLANRAQYTPTPVLHYNGTKKGDRLNLRYDQMLSPPGLLQRVLMEKDQGERALAVHVALNHAQFVTDNPEIFGIRSQDFATPSEFKAAIAAKVTELTYTLAADLYEEGWLLNKENLMWDTSNGAAMELLLKAFPDAVAFTGYNHRLSAPLLPTGFLGQQEILFRSPEAYKEEFNSALVSELFDSVVNLKSVSWALKATEEDMDPGEAVAAAENVLKNMPLDIGKAWTYLEGVVGNAIVAQWHEQLVRKCMVPGAVPQETDGSGLYDPEHPVWAELVGKYGPVPFQFSCIREDGLFCKGIVVPRDGLGVATQLAPNQIKGALKGKIAEGTIETGVWMGVMNTWSKPGTLPIGFQILEMIGLKNPLTKEVIDSLLEENMNKLFSKGADGLLQEVAREDEHLALVVKLVMALKGQGANINPLSVDMIQSAIQRRMKKALYAQAQGLGVRGRQLVAVLDASLNPGTVVLPGEKYDSEVAIWRYPTLLPQGLVTAVVVKPSKHHLLGGKPIRNTVFMHPQDLTLCLQGDDDGDIVGVSSDPRMVHLFKNRYTEQRFQIEPKGVKYLPPTLSDEGRKYGVRDPMGPIGLTCNWQAKLFACGDWMGALAMAVINQYSVDSAKRMVVWPDPAKIAQMDYWTRDDKGVYHLRDDAKLDPQAYEGEAFPMRYYRKWVNKRLEALGIRPTDDGEMPEALAWRIQWEGPKMTPCPKRISGPDWRPCRVKDGGFHRIHRGNWVHYAHDSAYNLWKQHEASWNELMGGKLENLALRDVPYRLLASKGIHRKPTCNSWEAYKELQERCGIVAFGREFKRLKAQNLGEEVEQLKVSELLNNLHYGFRSSTADELLTIWYWEMTDVWSSGNSEGAPTYSEKPVEGWTKVNRPNYAFRAATFPGSPILAALGIEEGRACGFIREGGLHEKVAAWALVQAKPWDALAQKMWANTTHGQARKDEQGNPVPFHQCKQCAEDLRTTTVRMWRKRTSTEIEGVLKALVHALNARQVVGTSSPGRTTDYDEGINWMPEE